MPIEVALWRLGEKLTRVKFSPMETEKRLESLIGNDVTIVDANLLLIGKQVQTLYGGKIDLLALDSDGNLIVLELKRNRTPREVVAQLLDYGSWVRSLEDQDIAKIFETYLEVHHPHLAGTSLDKAFMENFQVDEMPETLNESHELMIVAGELDDSTERIIGYLADEYGVSINAVFFRYFQDGDRDYISRAWLIDPSEVEAKVEEKRVKLPWNGEYYVSFGHREHGRHWDDARKYGFISAGGGEFHTKTLFKLEPDARIWVNVPGKGYVGVGTVVDGPVPPEEFLVKGEAGETIPITKAALAGKLTAADGYAPGAEEYVVRVNWIKNVPLSDAVREKGLFGNQNTVARPVTTTWNHTVDRLKKRFDISP